jgi:hypothetical protein
MRFSSRETRLRAMKVQVRVSELQGSRASAVGLPLRPRVLTFRDAGLNRGDAGFGLRGAGPSLSAAGPSFSAVQDRTSLTVCLASRRGAAVASLRQLRPCASR